MGTMITLRKSLGLITRNTHLILEKVNNRRTPYIAVPSAIFYFEIRQYSPSAGTRLTQVISVIYLNLPIPIKTPMELYLYEMMIPSSSARMRIKYRNI